MLTDGGILRLDKDLNAPRIKKGIARKVSNLTLFSGFIEAEGRADTILEQAVLGAHHHGAVKKSAM